MYYPITEKYMKEYIEKYTEKQNCTLMSVDTTNANTGLSANLVKEIRK